MSVAIATVPDDMLYEVVDGQIKEKIVGCQESEIATLLVEFLAPFVRMHQLGKIFGETIFLIDQAKDLQRRPDVAFVSHSKWPFNRRAPNVAVWDMVPDLAIEVVSPTNSAVRGARQDPRVLRGGREHGSGSSIPSRRKSTFTLRRRKFRSSNSARNSMAAT